MRVWEQSKKKFDDVWRQSKEKLDDILKSLNNNYKCRIKILDFFISMRDTDVL